MKKVIDTEVKIKCYTEKDMNEQKAILKGYGYTVTHDCMWAVVYEKGGSSVTLIREF